MKKNILTLTFLFAMATSQAQVFQPATLYGKYEKGLAVQRIAMFPTGCGNPSTPAAPDLAVRQAASYFDSCNHRYWLWDPKLGTWDTVFVGGGGGSSNIENVGSAYRLAVQGTNQIKTINFTNGLTPDSATSNEIHAKLGGRLTENTSISGANTRTVTIDSVLQFSVNYNGAPKIFTTTTQAILYGTTTASNVAAGNNFAQIASSSNNSIALAGDTASSKQRISYTSNVGGSFTKHSLIDKNYLDSIVSIGTAVDATKWSRSGNTGITDADKLGPVNEKSLRFITNNIERAKIDSAGNFNIDYALMTGGNPGNPGDFLISDGPDSQPAWTDPVAALNSYSWVLTGNTGLDSSTAFIGRTDNGPFAIRTNNTTRVLVSRSGNVGIGENSPQYKLDVAGSFRLKNGTQAANRFLKSDGDGLAQWSTLPNDIQSLQDVTNVGLVTDDSIFVKSIYVNGNYPSSISRIRLVSDPTFNQRARIEGGNEATGGTGREEGAIYFATGGNPVFEIDGGENNNIYLHTDGYVKLYGNQSSGVYGFDVFNDSTRIFNPKGYIGYDSIQHGNPTLQVGWDRSQKKLVLSSGTPTLTSSYVGYGGTGNKLTGSSGFVFDSTNTELRLGGISDQGVYQLQMNGPSIYRYGSNNNYALLLRPSGASDPYTPLLGFQATSVNTGISRTGNDYGGKFTLEGADNYVYFASFYTSLPNVKIRSYSYSSGAGADAATVQIRNPDAAAIGLSIKGFTSATGDLLQFLNSSGTVLSAFNKTGSLIIGGTAPAASAALEVNSTTQGILIPRMTSTQRDAISSPADWLQIICTDCTATDGSTGVLQVRNNSAGVWKNAW